MPMPSCKRWAAAMLLVWIASPVMAAEPDKVLRLALPDITGFDPHQISDLYSARVVNVIRMGRGPFMSRSQPPDCAEPRGG